MDAWYALQSLGTGLPRKSVKFKHNCNGWVAACGVSMVTRRRKSCLTISQTRSDKSVTTALQCRVSPAIRYAQAAPRGRSHRRLQLARRSVQVGTATAARATIRFGGTTIVTARSPTVGLQQSASCILVVDDEELIRWVSVEILRDAGYHVLEANNAMSAIAAIEAHPGVELLFCDVNMPGNMNGIELAAEVFRRWPEIKLLITSGRAHYPDGELPDHGTFLPKPYGLRDLLDAVGNKLAPA